MRKLKSRSGFTLAEALVAILILLMVSSIVAAGIPAAKSSYEKVVVASNAEVLLSTTISTLRNELATGKVISMLDGTGNEITSGTAMGLLYYNSRTGASSKLWYGTAEDQEGTAIWYQRYAETELSLGGETTRLMSEAVSTEGLNAAFDAVEFKETESNKIIQFDGLRVDSKTGHPVATRGGTGKFSIRVIQVDYN